MHYSIEYLTDVIPAAYDINDFDRFFRTLGPVLILFLPWHRPQIKPSAIFIEEFRPVANRSAGIVNVNVFEYSFMGLLPDSNLRDGT